MLHIRPLKTVSFYFFPLSFVDIRQVALVAQFTRMVVDSSAIEEHIMVDCESNDHWTIVQNGVHHKKLIRTEKECQFRLYFH